MKRASYTIALALALTGCGPDPTMRMRDQTKAHQVEPPAVVDINRFDVTRVGVFYDDIAYDERRGVYVIVDRQTGREYVGVSGVGIAETGTHSGGKTQHPDER